MKKVLFVILINLLLSAVNTSSAQNFSNKGKLFWGGHMRHIGGTQSNFALYITTEAANGAVVRVSIPGGTYNQLFIVPANSITVVTIPSTQTYISCTDCKSNNAVKIQSLTSDIVVYEHIYHQYRSDATLLIPVETLGSEYYAVSFTQSPVDANSRSQMLLIGVEDSTFVDITPRVAFNPGKTANVTYTIMLNEGEAYQVQSNSDMTGSRIKARSNNGSSCKKVAAFSGSSFVRMGCGGASSGDNLLQQLFPTSTWGTQFLAAPLKTRSTDVYRVLAMEDATQVRLNGVLVSTLNRGNFYTFQNTFANSVVTTKPVTLAQYPRSQNCDNRTGDPTIIVIPPIEQMVKNVTMYSSPYEDITGQYLNIITKLSDTGLFRLDNNKVSFVVHPNNTAYAYSQVTTNPGNHRLTSDSNFMVVAYGFGNFESYGYAGGTNIRNLVQSISASKDSVCLGDTFDFLAEISYTPSSIKWYLGDGRTDTSVRNIKHSYAKAGNYVVSLVTTRSGITDCSSTDSTVYRVKVHDYPTAQFLVRENCLNDTFYFIDSSKANSTFSHISTYSWIFGDSTTSSAANPVKYFNRIGSYTTRLKIANNNFCFDSVDVVHHVNPHPKIAISAGDSCPGIDLTIKDDGSIDAGSVASWQWLVDSTDTYFNKSFNASFTAPGTHTLALTAISDSACVTFATDSFTIYEPALAKFSITDVCIGSESIAFDSSVNATTIDWDFAGTAYTGNNPAHTFPNPGNYNIKQLVQSAEGCKDSVIQSTEVFSLPPSNWSISGKCSGDLYRFNPQFDTTAFGSLSHQWTIDGIAENHGFSWSRLLSGAGNTQVKLKVTDINSCSDSSAATVYINPKPIALASFTSKCEGEEAVLTDLTLGNFTSTWVYRTTSSNDSILFLVPLAQNELVKLNVQSDSGCLDSTTLSLTYSAKPQVNFSMTGNCPDVPVVFGSSIVSVDPINSYRWFENNAPLSSQQSFNKSYPDKATYTIKLVAETDKGCTDSSIQVLNILDKPVVTVTKQDVCEGSEIVIDASIQLIDHTVSQVNWLFNNKNYSGFSITDTIQTAGYYPFVISITSNANCVFNDYYRDSVRVFPKAVANFTPNPRISTLKNPDISFVNSSQFGGIWLWDFGDDSKSSIQNPIHRYDDTGTFLVTLWANNSFNCPDSTSDTVTMRPQLYCFNPNAFTPNGDGLNQGFIPFCEGYVTFNMKIWNRWGQLVYQTSDYKAWDGRDAEGNDAMEGVYVFEAVMKDLNNDLKVERGSFTLLR